MPSERSSMNTKRGRGRCSIAHREDSRCGGVLNELPILLSTDKPKNKAGRPRKCKDGPKLNLPSSSPDSTTKRPHVRHRTKQVPFADQQSSVIRGHIDTVTPRKPINCIADSYTGNNSKQFFCYKCKLYFKTKLKLMRHIPCNQSKASITEGCVSKSLKSAKLSLKKRGKSRAIESNMDPSSVVIQILSKAPTWNTEVNYNQLSKFSPSTPQDTLGGVDDSSSLCVPPLLGILKLYMASNQVFEFIVSANQSLLHKCLSSTHIGTCGLESNTCHLTMSGEAKMDSSSHFNKNVTPETASSSIAGKVEKPQSISDITKSYIQFNDRSQDELQAARTILSLSQWDTVDELISTSNGCHTVTTSVIDSITSTCPPDEKQSKQTKKAPYKAQSTHCTNPVGNPSSIDSPLPPNSIKCTGVVTDSEYGIYVNPTLSTGISCDKIIPCTESEQAAVSSHLLLTSFTDFLQASDADNLIMNKFYDSHISPNLSGLVSLVDSSSKSSGKDLPESVIDIDSSSTANRKIRPPPKKRHLTNYARHNSIRPFIEPVVVAVNSKIVDSCNQPKTVNMPNEQVAVNLINTNCNTSVTTPSTEACVGTSTSIALAPRSTRLSNLMNGNYLPSTTIVGNTTTINNNNSPLYLSVNSNTTTMSYPMAGLTMVLPSTKPNIPQHTSPSFFILPQLMVLPNFIGPYLPKFNSPESLATLPTHLVPVAHHPESKSCTFVTSSLVTPIPTVQPELSETVGTNHIATNTITTTTITTTTSAVVATNNSVISVNASQPLRTIILQPQSQYCSTNVTSLLRIPSKDTYAKTTLMNGSNELISTHLTNITSTNNDNSTDSVDSRQRESTYSLTKEEVDSSTVHAAAIEQIYINLSNTNVTAVTTNASVTKVLPASLSPKSDEVKHPIPTQERKPPTTLLPFITVIPATITNATATFIMSRSTNAAIGNSTTTIISGKSNTIPLTTTTTLSGVNTPPSVHCDDNNLVHRPTVTSNDGCNSHIINNEGTSSKLINILPANKSRQCDINNRLHKKRLYVNRILNRIEPKPKLRHGANVNCISHQPSRMNNSITNRNHINGPIRGKYRCQECGVVCPKPCLLRKHYRAHSNLRPYVCRYCDVSFKTRGNLGKHMKSRGHQDRCIRDLGLGRAPLVVDDATQIDHEALKCQRLITSKTGVIMCTSIALSSTINSLTASPAPLRTLPSPISFSLQASTTATITFSSGDGYANLEFPDLKGKASDSSLTTSSLPSHPFALCNATNDRSHDNVVSEQLSLPNLCKSSDAIFTALNYPTLDATIRVPAPNVNAVNLLQDLPMNLSAKPQEPISLIRYVFDSSTYSKLNEADFFLPKSDSFQSGSYSTDCTLQSVNSRLPSAEVIVQTAVEAARNLSVDKLGTKVKETDLIHNAGVDTGMCSDVERGFSPALGLSSSLLVNNVNEMCVLPILPNQRRQNLPTEVQTNPTTHPSCVTASSKQIAYTTCDTTFLAPVSACTKFIRNVDLNLDMQTAPPKPGQNSLDTCIAPGRQRTRLLFAEMKSTTNYTKQLKDPRPYKCSMCSVGFRVSGHLYKHYRSKSHLSTILQCSQLPNTTMDKIRQSNLGLAQFIDSDSGQLNLNKLEEFVKPVDKTNITANTPPNSNSIFAVADTRISTNHCQTTE